jgi:hypothetical protein
MRLERLQRSTHYNVSNCYRERGHRVAEQAYEMNEEGIWGGCHLHNGLVCKIASDKGDIAIIVIL